jgi:hypothetical protein
MKAPTGVRTKHEPLVDPCSRWAGEIESLRLLLWNRNIRDPKTLLPGWLFKVREIFGVEFCFATLQGNGANVGFAVPQEENESRLCWDGVSPQSQSAGDSNSFVNRQGLGRAFAVVLLCAPGKRPLGTVAMGSSVPRTFTRTELYVFQTLADDLAWALDLRESRSMHG